MVKKFIFGLTLSVIIFFSSFAPTISASGIKAVDIKDGALAITDAGGNVYGSAFFITDDYLITNSHVVDAYVETLAVDSTGKVYELWLIAKDVKRDLALLSIRKEATHSYYDLSDNLGLSADSVYKTVGNTDYYTFKVKEGTFSEYYQTLTPDSTDITNRRYYGHYGQVRAIFTFSGDPGNSGSPVLDKDGKVIGVVTARMNDGRAVVITIDELKAFLKPHLEKSVAVAMRYGSDGLSP